MTLATGIPREAVEAVNLGYLDPAEVDIAAYEADPDTFVEPHAGEVLYRLGPGRSGRGEADGRWCPSAVATGELRLPLRAFPADGGGPRPAVLVLPGGGYADAGRSRGPPTTPAGCAGCGLHAFVLRLPGGTAPAPRAVDGRDRRAGARPLR